jgi:hypothetical protein
MATSTCLALASSRATHRFLMEAAADNFPNSYAELGVDDDDDDDDDETGKEFSKCEHNTSCRHGIHVQCFGIYQFISYPSFYRQFDKYSDLANSDPTGGDDDDGAEATTTTDQSSELSSSARSIYILQTTSAVVRSGHKRYSQAANKKLKEEGGYAFAAKTIRLVADNYIIGQLQKFSRAESNHRFGGNLALIFAATKQNGAHGRGNHNAPSPVRH